MCGIAGVVTSDFDAESLVNMMVQSMHHRGPDNLRVSRVDDDVVLGHDRLSIIDPNPVSNQPFSKDELTIVFNGEIYNFKELKKKLVGVSFRTDSDTEVLLELWRFYGPSCLPMLNGMFAFAIYDRATKKMFLARDRFGIKPLFYSESGDCFSFSSELKALDRAFPKKKVSSSAIANSLALCWVPEYQCALEGVNKLPSGTYLVINAERSVELKSYHSIEKIFSTKCRTYSETEFESNVDDVLNKAVVSHLISDVPVGAFLSGGLDSSLLVAMAARSKPSIETYTIKFRDDDSREQSSSDDSRYSELVAKHLGVKLNTIEVKPDIVELFPKMVSYLDEPIGDSAAINTFLICEGARDNGVKVLLSGMGADEIFAGYRKHEANLYASYLRKLPKIIAAPASKLVDILPIRIGNTPVTLFRMMRRFNKFAFQPEALAFLRSYSYVSFEELPSIVESYSEVDLDRDLNEYNTMYSQARSGADLVNTMCKMDTVHFMQGLNLSYTDRASMAASVEVRVPFIENDVVDLALSIPSKLKIRRNQQKYILKRVAERYLPKDVIYRPKASFTLPLRSWLRGELKPLMEDYLRSDSGLVNRNIFRKTFIDKVIDDNNDSREDNSQLIWQLMTIEQWFRNREN